MQSTEYTAVRVTADSAHNFDQTRSRFEARAPIFDYARNLELVDRQAPWADVQAVVEPRLGPAGLASFARLDQGALLSLSGEPLDATLYLVGNPLIARQLTIHEPAAALYAPFRVAIHRDAHGVHVSYDKPSSVFASLKSPAIDTIAADLDEKIRTIVDDTCR